MRQGQIGVMERKEMRDWESAEGMKVTVAAGFDPKTFRRPIAARGLPGTADWAARRSRARAAWLFLFVCFALSQQ